MQAVPITEVKNRLSHYLRQVRRGARITIIDRGRPVAVLAPPTETDDEIKTLAADGLAVLPTAALSDEFLERVLPTPKQSVVEELLREREDRF